MWAWTGMLWIWHIHASGRENRSQTKDIISRVYNPIVLTSDSREMVEARFAYTSKDNTTDCHNGSDSNTLINTSSLQPTHPDFSIRFRSKMSKIPFKVMATHKITEIKQMILWYIHGGSHENENVNTHEEVKLLIQPPTFINWRKCSTLLAVCEMAKNPYLEWLQENGNPDFRMEYGR